MTVSAQTPINRSTGNGVTTVFPYTFKIISDADIEVTVDDVVKTLNVDYTVSGAGVDAGGNVTMTGAPANATSVVRRRNMALVRSTDYQDQGELPATTLDNDIDATVLMVQQLDERLDRTFSLPASFSGDSTLPAPEPGYLIGWDATGENLTNIPASVGSSLVDIAAPSGSSLVGYLPAGTGAVSTTVQTKLRERVSVLDFGAVGDGSTDDTAAIQAAMNTGKDVYFPYTANTYKVTSTLNLKAGQVLIGSGKYSADTGWYGISANMTAPIFTMGDGATASLRSMGFQNLTARNTGGGVIYSRYSTNWSAYNCSFTGVSATLHTIDMQQTYRVAFYNCDIGCSGGGYAAFLMDNSNVILFSNCAMSGGTTGGVADCGRSYNITFDACVFEISLYGLRFGTNPNVTYGGECNGVNIRGCSWEQYGIALQVGNSYSCRGVDIRGNYFSDTGTSGGIAKNTMMILGRISGLTIESNVFTPAATEYIFDFWHVLDTSSALPCVTAARIQNNEFTTIGAGYKLSGHFATFPSLGNQIAKGLMMEYGVTDKDHHFTTIGNRLDWDTGMVLPSTLTNTQIITTTPATGAYIEKVELLRVDPSANLGGTLQIGYSGGATYNLSVSLPGGVTWTNTGFGYYADITSLLSNRYCVVSDMLVLRITTPAGTGTIQVVITYRK